MSGIETNKTKSNKDNSYALLYISFLQFTHTHSFSISLSLYISKPFQSFKTYCCFSISISWVFDFLLFYVPQLLLPVPLSVICPRVASLPLSVTWILLRSVNLLRWIELLTLLLRLILSGNPNCRLIIILSSTKSSTIFQLIWVNVIFTFPFVASMTLTEAPR